MIKCKFQRLMFQYLQKVDGGHTRRVVCPWVHSPLRLTYPLSAFQKKYPGTLILWLIVKSIPIISLALFLLKCNYKNGNRFYT